MLGLSHNLLPHADKYSIFHQKIFFSFSCSCMFSVRQLALEKFLPSKMFDTHRTHEPIRDIGAVVGFVFRSWWPSGNVDLISKNWFPLGSPLAWGLCSFDITQLNSQLLSCKNGKMDMIWWYDMMCLCDGGGVECVEINRLAPHTPSNMKCVTWWKNANKRWTHCYKYIKLWILLSSSTYPSKGEH